MSKQKNDGTSENTNNSEMTVELEADIEKYIGEILPKQQRGAVVERVVSYIRSERFSGPMPHPKHLAQYEQVAPGAAERILVMAEKAQNHQIEFERTALYSDITDRSHGLWAGIIILSLLIVGGFVLAYIGNNIGSGILLGAAVLSVVGLLFKRPKNND